MRTLFSISLKRRATLGRLPRCGRAAAALPKLWQRSLPEVNPGVHPWSLPTRDSWMWRISPRETSRRASAGVIATTAKSPEPRMFLFPFFFFAATTADIRADFTTSRALDSRRHMVTDWVDWHQASISLMPVDLGLQMSLSLMTAKEKKKKKDWAEHLSLSFFLILFVPPVKLVSKCFHPVGNNFPPFFSFFFFLIISAFLTHVTAASNLSVQCTASRFSFIHGSLKRRAMERRTGPVLSPVKRERVDAKYSPPSALPV